MTSFISLVIVTTLFMLIIFTGLLCLKSPLYRLSKRNLIHLFELAVAGKATESDWDVFIEVPIGYDDELEGIRLECVNLTEEKAVFVDSRKRLVVNDLAIGVLVGLISRLSIDSDTT